MDRFSRLFQKSYESTTCELYIEMSRLVQLSSGNLPKVKVVLAASDNLKDLKMDADSQLPDEHLGMLEKWMFC